ncbi:hypothetical protein BJ508DRAFT_340548 [Ascobolus immersus RN42]|uniref:Uncharacterized protein n=1 Tax=Ascobolus immersus RN42 TaxID=1160509 RepID=A0A3N4HK55_ASCIM|nr:hypothetical protein BJ508DRAFT_340548 [Ascobolus immersus RN42]
MAPSLHAPPEGIKKVRFQDDYLETYQQSKERMRQYRSTISLKKTETESQQDREARIRAREREFERMQREEDMEIDLRILLDRQVEELATKQRMFNPIGRTASQATYSQITEQGIRAIRKTEAKLSALLDRQEARYAKKHGLPHKSKRMSRPETVQTSGACPPAPSAKLEAASLQDVPSLSEAAQTVPESLAADDIPFKSWSCETVSNDLVCVLQKFTHASLAIGCQLLHYLFQHFLAFGDFLLWFLYLLCSHILSNVTNSVKIPRLHNRPVDVTLFWIVLGLFVCSFILADLGFKFDLILAALFSLSVGTVIWLWNPAISEFAMTSNPKPPMSPSPVQEPASVFQCAAKRFTSPDPNVNEDSQLVEHHLRQSQTAQYLNMFRASSRPCAIKPYQYASAWVPPPQPTLGMKEPMPAPPAHSQWAKDLIKMRDAERNELLEKDASRVARGYQARFPPQYANKDHEFAANPGYKLERRMNYTEFRQREVRAPDVVPTSALLFKPLGMDLPTTSVWGEHIKAANQERWEKQLLERRRHHW